MTFFSKLLKWFILAVVCLVTLAAIFVGFGRAMIEEVSNYKIELESKLSQWTGYDVRIQSLSGEWKTYPEFIIDGLSVGLAHGSDRVPVTVHKIKVRMYLLSSLVHMEPQLGVTLDGVEAHLDYRDGKLFVAGFPEIVLYDRDSTVKIKYEDVAPWLDIVVDQPLLHLKGSRLFVNNLLPSEVLLDKINIRLSNTNNDKSLESSFLFDSGGRTTTLSARGRYVGQFKDRGSLHGQVYSELSDISVLTLLPEKGRQAAGLTLDKVEGGVKFWGNIDDGALRQITATLDLRNINIHSERKLQPAPIQNLSTTVQWDGNNLNDWILVFKDPRVRKRDIDWAPNLLYVRHQVVNDLNIFFLELDSFPLPFFKNYLLATDLLQDKGRETVEHISPGGTLRGLQFMIAKEGGKVSDFSASGRLDDLSLSAWKSYPGVKNVDIGFRAEKDESLFRVHGKNIELDYLKMFSGVLGIDYLNGEFILKRKASGYLLESGNITINNKEIRTGTQLSLLLPGDESTRPYLRLQSTLRNMNAVNVGKYLPEGILDEGLVDWLNGSIKDGYLVRGDIVVDGPLGRKNKESNKKKNNGKKNGDLSVLLGFAVDHATLGFLPDWPDVTDLSTDVVIDNGRVSAEIIRGEFLGAKLQGGQVLVVVPDSGPAILDIDVLASGSSESGMRALRETPLREDIGGVVDEFNSSGGKLEVNLALDIPLAEDPAVKSGAVETKVNADINVTGAAVEMPSNSLYVDNANGVLNFNLVDGLTAKKLEGEIFGGSFQGEIVSKLDGKQHKTVVMLTGDAELKAIKDWIQMPINAPLSGHLDYGLNIHVRDDLVSGKAKSYLVIKSDLYGVTADYPRPFNKTADEKTPFSHVMTLGRKDEVIRITYGNQLDIVLLLVEDGIKKIRIRVGPAKPGEPRVKLPKENKIKVEGTLSVFELDEWTRFYDAVKGEETHKNGSEAEAEAEKETLRLLQMVDQSSVVVEQLNLGDQKMGLVKFDVSGEKNGFKIGLDGENAQGTVSLPFYVMEGEELRAPEHVDNPLRIDLETLNFPGVKVGEGDSGQQEKDGSQKSPEKKKTNGKKDTTPEKEKLIDPDSIPVFDADIEHLLLGGKGFGSWVAKVRPVKGGVKIDPLDAELKNIKFAGSLDWLTVEGQQNTSLKGVFKAGNLSDVMTAMGMDPVITSESAELSTKGLGWPGTPFDLGVDQIAGPFTLSIKDGSFLKVKSGFIGRAWGALNIESWGSGTVAKKGLGFDSIKGDFVIKQGLLTIEKAHVDAPAVNMEIKGVMNLKKDTVDATLDVVIPVTRNLVIPAAGLVLGLPGLATAFLIEKAVGSELNKLTTRKYKIEGDISDPEMVLFSESESEKGKESQSSSESSSKPSSKHKTNADH